MQDLNSLSRTGEMIERGIKNGLHVGAQLFFARGDETIADGSAGLARPGVPMRPDTLMSWMIACKPVADMAVAQLWERGLLDLDDPVARHIPEFGKNGKEPITVRHLLTHTGGFRGLAGNWEQQPWAAVLAAVCDARLETGW